jgi:hypothetical protein
MEIWGGNRGICHNFLPLPMRDLGWDLTYFNYFLFFYEFPYNSMSRMVVTCGCGADGICHFFFFFFALICVWGLMKLRPFKLLIFYG